MTRLTLLAPVLFLVGCGSGTPAMNTQKMTDEEIRLMKEEDKRIDDEEKSGSGTAVGKPKKRK